MHPAGDIRPTGKLHVAVRLKHDPVCVVQPVEARLRVGERLKDFSARRCRVALRLTQVLGIEDSVQTTFDLVVDQTRDIATDTVADRGGSCSFTVLCQTNVTANREAVEEKKSFVNGKLAYALCMHFCPM